MFPTAIEGVPIFELVQPATVKLVFEECPLKFVAVSKPQVPMAVRSDAAVGPLAVKPRAILVEKGPSDGGIDGPAP